MSRPTYEPNTDDDDNLLEMLHAERPQGIDALIAFASRHTHDFFQRELVVTLFEYTGSLEMASAVAAAVPELQHLDVGDVVEDAQSNGKVMGLLARGADLADVVDAIACLKAQQQPYWVRAAAAAYELGRTVAFAVENRSPIAIALLIRSLPTDDVLRCEALFSLGFPFVQVAEALQLLGYSIDMERVELSVPVFYAGRLAAQHLGLQRALECVAPPLSPASWLPAFRTVGLAPSAAVLHLQERYACSSVMEIVRHMVAADCGEGLLEALQKNGFSTNVALESLARHGWHVDRMVSDLLARDLLASDIRDDLLDLGLSKAAIRDVLLRHAPADIVDLVVPV